MRSLVFALLGALLLGLALPAGAQAARPEGIEANGVMLIAVKTLADLAGAAVSPDRASGGIVITKGQTTVSLVANRPQMMANGRAELLPAPVLVSDGSFYAPAGGLGRALGLRMDWSPNTRVLSVAPKIGKIEHFSPGRRLAWKAGDFDGDKSEEIAYALTNLIGNPATKLWVVRGEATIWIRTIAGAVQDLAVRDATHDGKPDLLVTAAVHKGGKQVAMVYTYAWKGKAFKGIAATPAK
jgi:hypothetical protein